MCLFKLPFLETETNHPPSLPVPIPWLPMLSRGYSPQQWRPMVCSIVYLNSVWFLSKLRLCILNFTSYIEQRYMHMYTQTQYSMCMYTHTNKVKKSTNLLWMVAWWLDAVIQGYLECVLTIRNRRVYYKYEELQCLLQLHHLPMS